MCELHPQADPGEVVAKRGRPNRQLSCSRDRARQGGCRRRVMWRRGRHDEMDRPRGRMRGCSEVSDRADQWSIRDTAPQWSPHVGPERRHCGRLLVGLACHGGRPQSRGLQGVKRGACLIHRVVARHRPRSPEVSAGGVQGRARPPSFTGCGAPRICDRRSPATGRRGPSGADLGTSGLPPRRATLPSLHLLDHRCPQSRGQSRHSCLHQAVRERCLVGAPSWTRVQLVGLREARTTWGYHSIRVR